MEEKQWMDVPPASECPTSHQDLVDKLVMDGNIKSPRVEEVFRKIDRWNYISAEQLRGLQISKRQWYSGSLDLLENKVYATALEALDIQPRDAFLNVGSGTGYLSTIAGLLLEKGVGVNHGVEFQRNKASSACKKLEQFKSSSAWCDPLHFCEPQFFSCDIYDFIRADTIKKDRYYDKMFIGGSFNCDNDYQFLFDVLKDGAIAVILLDKTDETDKYVDLLVVKMYPDLTSHTEEKLLEDLPWMPRLVFGNLYNRDPEDRNKNLPICETVLPEPPSLKDACRQVILRRLTRSRYPFIDTLPVSFPAKYDLKHGREWHPCPPLKSLCGPSSKTSEKGAMGVE